MIVVGLRSRPEEEVELRTLGDPPEAEDSLVPEVDSLEEDSQAVVVVAEGTLAEDMDCGIELEVDKDLEGAHRMAQEGDQAGRKVAEMVAAGMTCLAEVVDTDSMEDIDLVMGSFGVDMEAAASL